MKHMKSMMISTVNKAVGKLMDKQSKDSKEQKKKVKGSKDSEREKKEEKKKGGKDSEREKREEKKDDKDKDKDPKKTDKSKEKQHHKKHEKDLPAQTPPPEGSSDKLKRKKKKDDLASVMQKSHDDVGKSSKEKKHKRKTESVMQPPLPAAGAAGAAAPVAAIPAAIPAAAPSTDPTLQQTIWSLPEYDLPMEPESPSEGPTIDPMNQSRPIADRDPEAMSAGQLANLRGFIAQYDKLGVKGLMDEFETIKKYNLEPFDVTSHEANPTKNRYKDIFCIEPSRVKLNDGNAGDYVHANYVKGGPLINTFITTQGPIELSIHDFWRMIVQENVGYIFMLCSIVELGKKKCEQYFPVNQGETVTYNDIKVRLESKEEDAHFINSKLLLEVPGKPKRFIYHHYWKNWPDRGVPVTALAGIRLLKSARLTTMTTLVHCSAGVGRTGTLVAIEWMLQKIMTSPPPYDMKEMLRALRNQRAHAIQTAPQYAYVAFAVFRLYAIVEPNQMAIFKKFSADMQTHAGVVIPVNPNAPTVVGSPAPPGKML